MTKPATFSPTVPVPAHVRPYVEALGENLAIRFLLNFGGAELYIAAQPTEAGRLAAVIGTEGARAIAGISDRLPRRVPLAKPWIAKVLHTRGTPTAEIARTLLTSDVTVRRWLRS